MHLAILAFILGVLSLPFAPQLIKLLPLLLTGLAIMVSMYFAPKKIHPILWGSFFFVLGCIYVTVRMQAILSWSLPADMEAKPVWITGAIISIPKIQDTEMRFVVRLKSINQIPQHTNLLIAWQNYPPDAVLVGDEWQWQVRLKQPHGLLNPGGFDYEKWLFSEGIRATGNVISGPENKILRSHFYVHPIEKLRQRLQEKLHQVLANQPTAGLITALIMGSQQGITQSQWEVMRRTGTNHLMAIAGVHIGFVAGFFYALTLFLWRRLYRCTLYLPAQQAAACVALLAACTYSALAGFALPTERALIMLSVFMVGCFIRRTLSPWNACTLALLIILLLDPLASLSISFWLSFAAVFAIFFGMGARLNPEGWWWKYGRLQWVISIGLIPISLVLFQQTSLIAFIANFVAVPAVGILVLPLALSGAVLLVFFLPLAKILCVLAAQILAYIWQFLSWLAQLPDCVWQKTMPNSWIFLATLFGVLLCMLPKGFPGRCSGLFFFLPLIFYRPETPAYGESFLTLLDVGQGLSAVIRTQKHLLVFDTGPPLGKMDDAGQRVILPYLQSIPSKRIDTMVISHGDSDHIGGAFSVLQHLPVTQIFTSVPEKFAPAMTQLCLAGTRWQWDGVDFEFLSPTPEILHQNNNSSCVLRVSSGTHAILLTGDIEKPTEKNLLARQVLRPADILIAPHHGSQTSSTPGFIQAVQPQYVLFPVGYENRYHFPHPAVMARYAETRATLLATSASGAIFLKLHPRRGVYGVQLWREEDKKAWRSSEHPWESRTPVRARASNARTGVRDSQG